MSLASATTNQPFGTGNGYRSPVKVDTRWRRPMSVRRSGSRGMGSPAGSPPFTEFAAVLASSPRATSSLVSVKGLPPHEFPIRCRQFHMTDVTARAGRPTKPAGDYGEAVTAPPLSTEGERPRVG